jgi:hypothetical protein
MKNPKKKTTKKTNKKEIDIENVLSGNIGCMSNLKFIWLTMRDSVDLKIAKFKSLIKF